MLGKQVVLSAESVGIEQVVSDGNRFTGILPPSGTLETVTERNVDREVVEIPDLGADGGGLYNLYEWFTLAGRHIYVTSLHIATDDPTVEWAAYLTSGLRDGDATTLDDTSFDVELASGTGGSMQALQGEMLPQQCIRITTTALAAGTTLRAILYVAAMTSEHGLRT